MSKLENFISNLDNTELASFYHFRFNSFMKNSKKIILNELKNRNMKEYQIEKYLPKLTEKIEREITDKKICPKCYSNKFYDSTEIEKITIEFETIEYSENYKTCLICLYSQEKIDKKKKKHNSWNIVSLMRILRGKKMIKN